MTTPQPLAGRRCVPCEGGVPALDGAACATLASQVPGWTHADGRLKRRFTFGNFVELMRFVNAMAGVAESEGHHPDFTVHYNVLDVEVWTHAIGGLSENDFILAAKLSALAKP